MPSYSDKACVVLSLCSSEETLQQWPHTFLLQLTVTLSLEGLTCSLKAINNGETPFDCHTLLHTYLAVPDISTVAIAGYQGLEYSDKTQDGAMVVDQDDVNVVRRL